MHLHYHRFIYLISLTCLTYRVVNRVHNKATPPTCSILTTRQNTEIIFFYKIRRLFFTCHLGQLCSSKLVWFRKARGVTSVRLSIWTKQRWRVMWSHSLSGNGVIRPGRKQDFFLGVFTLSVIVFFILNY